LRYLLLTIAVVSGFIGGLLRAFISKRPIVIPYFQAGWLVPAAFIPQALCFYLPVTRTRIPDNLAAILLIISQLMLLFFAWLNFNQRGFLMLGLGVILNVLVVTTNGGWMPISPDILLLLNPHSSQQNWVVGQRLGMSKDIVLPFDRMIFPLLSDRIVLPPLLSQGLAYSIGDIFIALGAFQLMYSISCKSLRNESEVNK
jgi:hypothetical protein